MICLPAHGTPTLIPSFVLHSTVCLCAPQACEICLVSQVSRAGDISVYHGFLAPMSLMSPPLSKTDDDLPVSHPMRVRMTGVSSFMLMTTNAHPVSRISPGWKQPSPPFSRADSPQCPVTQRAHCPSHAAEPSHTFGIDEDRIALWSGDDVDRPVPRVLRYCTSMHMCASGGRLVSKVHVLRSQSRHRLTRCQRSTGRACR